MSDTEVEVGSKRSYDEYGEIDGGDRHKRSRSDTQHKLRFLLVGRFCGGIIGKGGENIKRLRKEYSVQVNMPDTRTNDRVVSINGDRENIFSVVKEMLDICAEAPYSVDNREKTVFELNLLVNTDQVGTVIGKAGARIKEIRQESNGKVKVYQDCLPNSNERIVAIGGEDVEKTLAALDIVLDTLNTRPRKTQTIFYDPGNTSDNRDSGRDSGRDNRSGGGGGGGGGGRHDNRDDRRDDRDNGNQGGGGFNSLPGVLNLGGLGLAGAANLLGQLGVGAGATGILGAGGAGAMWGGNNDSRGGANDGILGSGGQRDGGFGMDSRQSGSNSGGGILGQGGRDGGSRGGDRGDRGGDRDNRRRDSKTNDERLDFGQMKTVTKITVSNDMCGAIIGKSGARIKEIRHNSGARVDFTESEKGSKEDRVLTLTGTQQQIQIAEQMMTECVRNRNN